MSTIHINAEPIDPEPAVAERWARMSAEPMEAARDSDKVNVMLHFTDRPDELRLELQAAIAAASIIYQALGIGFDNTSAVLAKVMADYPLMRGALEIHEETRVGALASVYGIQQSWIGNLS